MNPIMPAAGEADGTWGGLLKWLNRRCTDAPGFIATANAREHLAPLGATEIAEEVCEAFMRSRAKMMPAAAVTREAKAAKKALFDAWVVGLVKPIIFPKGFGHRPKSGAKAGKLPRSATPGKRSKMNGFHALAGSVPLRDWIRAALSMYAGVPDEALVSPDPRWQLTDGWFRLRYKSRVYKCHGNGIGEALGMWAATLEPGESIGRCSTPRSIMLSCAAVCNATGWDAAFCRPPQLRPKPVKTRAGRLPQKPFMAEAARRLAKERSAEIRREVAKALKPANVRPKKNSIEGTGRDAFEHPAGYTAEDPG